MSIEQMLCIDPELYKVQLTVLLVMLILSYMNHEQYIGIVLVACERHMYV